MHTLENEQLIPWRLFFSDVLVFSKKHALGILVFFLLFLCLTLPEQLDLIELSDLTPQGIWISFLKILILMMISYFVSVSFIVWIAKEIRGDEVSFRRIARTSISLLAPLTVLSIRGSILFCLGLIALILPGVYFYFKYSIASFSLILEGWKNEYTPIYRAEQIIEKYRFTLVFLGALALVELAGLSSIDVLLKICGIHLDLSLKVVSALVQTTISTFYYLYATFVMLFIIKRT